MKTNVIFKSAMLFAMMSMSTMMMAQTQVQVHEKVKRQPVEVQLNNKTMLKERHVGAVDAQPIRRSAVSQGRASKLATVSRRHAELRCVRTLSDTTLVREAMPVKKMK